MMYMVVFTNNDAYEKVVQRTYHLGNSGQNIMELAITILSFRQHFADSGKLTVLSHEHGYESEDS